MGSIHSRLRAKIIPAIGLCSALLLVAVSVLTTLEFRSNDRTRLSQIGQLVLGLSTTMEAGQNRTIIEPSAFGRLDLEDYIIYVERDGLELYSSPNLAAVAVRPAPNMPTFDVLDNTYDLIHASDPGLNTRAVVGVLSSETVRSIQEIVLLTTVLFVVAAAGLLRVTSGAIKTALSPLHKFNTEVERRDSGNLAPLDLSQVPDELEAVAQSINGLMSKLELALVQERQFVSNAAHELRTPLAGIIAQIDALPRGYMDHEGENAIEKIREAALRSSRLITQLLHHARALSVGDDKTILKPFEIKDLVEEVVATHAQSVFDRDIELQVELEPDLPSVHHPRDLMFVVVDNILDNALKHGASKGGVRVFATSEGDTHLALKIEDDGKGLTNEQFKTACSRFERLEQTGKDGFGLGLSLVADLCARLGVEISSYPSCSGGLGVKLLLRTDT